MKKYILLIVSILFTSTAFWYDLSQEEKDNISLLNSSINSQFIKYWYDWFKSLISNINILIEKNNTDEKKVAILILVRDNLVNYLQNIDTQLENAKKEAEILELKEKEAQSSKNQMLNNYFSSIIWDKKVNDKCIKHYDFIDNIAKNNNFPTALIISTWKKEFNCSLANPANGWGPFQTTSKYYVPWEISLEIFWNEIVDFINVTKWKWSFFNSHKNLKDKFWLENINITYDNFSLKQLQMSAIMYNWYNSAKTLDSSGFANTNLNNSIKWNVDGIVTYFLKILNWAKENGK